MKLLEKILVPTDFHGSADRSVEMALELAKRFNSEVILLHIHADNPGLTEYEDMINHEVDRKLQAVRSKFSDNGTVKVSYEIRKGSKFDEINRLAEEQDVNLIIMGSGERASKNKPRLGTTTKRVIESSTKPVWVMTEHSTPSIKSVVCPVDFSAPAHRALENAIHLARHFKAELMVIAVNESFTDLLDGLQVPLEDGSYPPSKKFEQELDQFLEDFDFYDVVWQKKVIRGKPHFEILEAIGGPAKDTLLVMGTTGRSGIGKLLIGSVTEKVTRQLPCAFITMKEENLIEVRLSSKLNELQINFEQGIELLENGLAREALNQFKLCLNVNDMHIPSWYGMAKAYHRLGDIDKEKSCNARAQEILNHIEEQKIVAEIRSKHWLVSRR